LVVTVAIKREISLKRLPTVMAEAGRMVGTILIILGCALAMSTWLVDQDVPARLFSLAREHIDSPAAFLLTLNVFLLLAGMTMDIFSAIVILTPLLLPVAAGYGIHPVHFGIVMLANLQIGYFLPPMGMDLFIAAYRFKMGVLTLARACVPFFILVGICVLIIAWVPWLSLALL
jgi:tripartite ATP-independent transporter DctM subunit